MSGRPPLVMVVDDFRDGRELIVEVLGQAGLRTEQACDGSEALVKARAAQPDVILMDLSLPGMDGWEITRRLKADPVTRAILVVALTAHTTRAPLDRARAAGCDLVLTKPCSPDELISRLKQLLAGAPATDGEPVA